jgi:hypothetical protein
MLTAPGLARTESSRRINGRWLSGDCQLDIEVRSNLKLLVILTGLLGSALVTMSEELRLAAAVEVLDSGYPPMAPENLALVRDDPSWGLGKPNCPLRSARFILFPLRVTIA